MQYNFDEVIDRNSTASEKWDGLHKRFGVSDVLPMWVADMDFRSPAPVLEALRQRVEHGVYGYSMRTEGYYQAMMKWLAQRQGWQVDRQWFSHAPGIVPALGFLLQSLTEPGDKVLIQPPVYHPFKRVIESHGRSVVMNPLMLVDGRYEIDFDDLKTKVNGAKALILSNPHNPVGRVWTRSELTRLGEICLDAGVIVISDEIHSDLVFKQHQHIPFASLAESFAQQSVTCIAPSKTFNLAGLQTAAVIIPNPELKSRYDHVLGVFSLSSPNLFGATALEVAYTDGAEWLDQLLTYLTGNLEFLSRFFATRLPEVKVIEPEGTYLVWLDFRALNLTNQELDDLLLKEAKVAMNEGHLFGSEGSGFQRINIACPRKTLADALERIVGAVQRHRAR